MNQKVTLIVMLAALGMAIAAGVMWVGEHESVNQARSRLISSVLQPIASLLREDQSLIQELQTEPFSEPDSGILESYLGKIRRDGVPKHADMKQKLDQLAENNTEIVALVKVYTQQVHAPAFTGEADRFRNYASAWRDRWNSVMELFMAGGNYPSAGIPFPREFSAVVEQQIAASK